jgi:hypothetical protein
LSDSASFSGRWGHSGDDPHRRLNNPETATRRGQAASGPARGHGQRRSR